MQASLFDDPRRFSLDDLLGGLDVPSDGLRWYQREAVDSIKRELEVNRSTLLVMCTGGGKTACFSQLAKEWDKGAVLVLAHREELIQQAKERLESVVGEYVDIERGGEQSSNRARYVVGSIDSVRQKNRLERMGHDRFGLVIVDECFPAGTPIATPDGHRDIAKLRPGDEVLAMDHISGMVGPCRVSSLSIKVSQSMWRMRYGGSSIICTSNHPFFVRGRGYVEASEVRNGDMLYVRDRFLLRDQIPVGSSQAQLLENVLPGECVGPYGEYQPPPRQRPNENQQSHAQGRQSGTDEVHAQGDGARSTGSPWERPWRDGGGVSDSDCARLANQRSRGNSYASGLRVPDELQAGRWELRAEDRHRGGRTQPLRTETPRAGSEEGGLPAWVRVDSSESVEPTSPRGDLVYNLEVEGSHTYFANETLVHNCHHATSPSYTKALDWFGPAKVLGVTATPDRGDEQALGKAFESVAYVFDIEQGIEDGCLVPLRGQHVDVDAVDLSAVAKSAGDLQAGDLDEVMTTAVAGIVHETLRLHPERPAVAFFPGVRSAEFAAQTFNEKRPGSACFISGATPKEERAMLVRDFKAGRYHYLCNCMVATEGFDAPRASMIIHGRPTLSRALYAQITGRGTRVLPGVVDSIYGRERAAERRAAIAASAKPDCLLLDFVKNSGKHDLVTPEDLLGGSYSEEEVKLAKKKRGGEGDVKEQLEAARAELRALAKVAKSAKVSSQVRDFDPFRALRIDMADEKRYSQFGSPMSTGQWDSLARLGVPEEDLRAMSRRGASKLLDEMNRRRKANLCTYKQARWLSKYGQDPTNVSFSRATEALDYVFTQRKAKASVDGAHLNSLLTRQRESGEEG